MLKVNMKKPGLYYITIYYTCTVLPCCITKRHQDSCTCHGIVNQHTILSRSFLIRTQKHVHMGGIKQNTVSTNSK
jgi:hypothetical protein